MKILEGFLTSSSSNLRKCNSYNRIDITSFQTSMKCSLMATMLVGEKLTFPLALGGVLIFVGVFLVTK